MLVSHDGFQLHQLSDYFFVLVFHVCFRKNSQQTQTADGVCSQVLLGPDRPFLSGRLFTLSVVAWM